MQAAQFGVRQPQDRFVVIKDRAFRDTEVRLIDISTKRDLAQANRGKFFDGVYHCHVSVGLIFENAQLGRAIISHGAITIEMIGSEVEPETDRRVEGLDRLQLKRAHFDCEHVKWFVSACHLGQRFADVAASDCSLAAGVQHLGEQLGRRGFAVRAGNGDDWNFTELRTEFELADHFDLAQREIAGERRSRIDAGT